eukprot:TRINITY_DN44183_c0_g1_i5.p1 TRINITY_DN44183_c0_g1~~TRINITY_DN44183_c0_g1_i5.p1  ORF type:complete len:200 (+),score=61.77 TRINITY_DN44183_c0_g1_i5:197-796(+)
MCIRDRLKGRLEHLHRLVKRREQQTQHEPCDPKPVTGSDRAAHVLKEGPGSDELFIGGLHPLIRIEELDEVLSSFGKVAHLSLPIRERSFADERNNVVKNRGFAFCIFKDPMAAQQCYDELNESTICGNGCQVQLCRKNQRVEDYVPGHKGESFIPIEAFTPRHLAVFHPIPRQVPDCPAKIFVGAVPRDIAAVGPEQG